MIHDDLLLRDIERGRATERTEEYLARLHRAATETVDGVCHYCGEELSIDEFEDGLDKHLACQAACDHNDSVREAIDDCARAVQEQLDEQQWARTYGASKGSPFTAEERAVRDRANCVVRAASTSERGRRLLVLDLLTSLIESSEWGAEARAALRAIAEVSLNKLPLVAAHDNAR